MQNSFWFYYQLLYYRGHPSLQEQIFNERRNNKKALSRFYLFILDCCQPSIYGTKPQFFDKTLHYFLMRSVQDACKVQCSFGCEKRDCSYHWNLMWQSGGIRHHWYIHTHKHKDYAAKSKVLLALGQKGRLGPPPRSKKSVHLDKPKAFSDKFIGIQLQNWADWHALELFVIPHHLRFWWRGLTNKHLRFFTSKAVLALGASFKMVTLIKRKRNYLFVAHRKN